MLIYALDAADLCLNHELNPISINIKNKFCHLLWGSIINSQEVVRNPEIRQLHQINSKL